MLHLLPYSPSLSLSLSPCLSIYLSLSFGLRPAVIKANCKTFFSALFSAVIKNRKSIFLFFFLIPPFLSLSHYLSFRRTKKPNAEKLCGKTASKATEMHWTALFLCFFSCSHFLLSRKALAGLIHIYIYFFLYMALISAMDWDLVWKNHDLKLVENFKNL